ncbi:MAG TPA: hypothetical protein VJ913_11435 [Actinomycetota bacterium]|nr:hypothetical protein [Actinomycetota bacterium]
MGLRTRASGRVLAAVMAVLFAGLLGLGTSSLATASSRSAAGVHDAPEVSKRALHDGMRRLWVDHVTWTRLFIVSFVADLPDLQATTDRLLQNQVDIGDAIKPFYGKAAANQLTALLTDHILTAAELLGAAKADDQTAFEEAKADWYANAREIARFLHDANPDHWRLADLRTMMRVHLDLTLQEAAQQLAGDFAASVATYDEVETEILHMADMLSAGIVAQFPNAFR